MLDKFKKSISKNTAINIFIRKPFIWKIRYLTFVSLATLVILCALIFMIVITSLLSVYRSKTVSIVGLSLVALRDYLCVNSGLLVSKILGKWCSKNSQIWVNIRSESSLLDGYLSKVASCVISTIISWVLCLLLVSNILEGFTWRVFNSSKSFFGLCVYKRGALTSLALSKLLITLVIFLVSVGIFYTYHAI